ncbi:diguanylate cyclase [Sulfurimonas sp.]|nr:diguanylate cyclase [Sulfurimonas sp.]
MERSFLILLPKLNLQQATEAANKIKNIIGAKDFLDVGKRTASFGVAALNGEESLNSILNRADQALYRAKDGGRNKVEVDSI